MQRYTFVDGGLTHVSYIQWDDNGAWVYSSDAQKEIDRLTAELEQMTAERDRLAGLYARELEAARTLHPGNSVGDITTVIGAKIRRLQEDLEERTLQHRVQLDNAVRLQDELFQAKRLMDGVREMARDRNPNGATILDFMAVWNEQYQQQIKVLTAELDQTYASVRSLCAAREEDGRRIVELEAERDRLAVELASVTADRDERAVQKGEFFAEIERLRADRDQLKTELDAIEAYVRANHNGYDPEAREAWPSLTQPATALEAIRDLTDERRYLHSREVEMLEKDRDRWKAATERLAELYRASHRCLYAARTYMTPSIPTPRPYSEWEAKAEEDIASALAGTEEPAPAKPPWWTASQS